MTVRLVCRSAPLKTAHIAQALAIDAVGENVHNEGPWDNRVKRTVVATPAQTDNGQCWSEEIFSLL